MPIKQSRPNRFVIAFAIAMVCACGCDPDKPSPIGLNSRPEPEMTGDLGAATIEELKARYEEAHKANDIKALRSLAFWNARAGTRRGDYGPQESDIEELFQYPLEKAEYQAIPRVAPQQDPAFVKNAERAHAMAETSSVTLTYTGGPYNNGYVIVGVLGKIMLNLDDDVVVDPSFAVMKFKERYYIYVSPLVLKDSVESLRDKRPPTYVAEPLGSPIEESIRKL